MRASTIAAEIQTFIEEEILCDQGKGLVRTTPLLELGILDSFGLLKLVAHVNASYGLALKPEHLSGHDFASIDALSTFVGRKLVDTPPRQVRPSRSPQDSIVEFEAPACAQVFVTFIGLGIINSAEFFSLAGLDDRNLVVFRDPYDRSYRTGVSAALPTPEAICDWLHGWIAQRPHIEEVYCVGVSSGGPIAMIVGDRLRAKTVWAFGPRTTAGNPAAEVAQRMGDFLAGATGKALPVLLAGLTESDRQAIDAQMTPEVLDYYYRGLLDPERVLDRDHLAEVVDALSRGSGSTEQRVYFVEQDACDAAFVEAVRNCPGVTLTAIEPSDAPPPHWTFAPWVPPPTWLCRNHLVIDLLRDRGALGGLFPPFRAAR